MTKNVVNTDDRVTPPVATKVSEAEFVDADGLKALFGIRRSLAYTLLGEGRIKGISLRRAGNARGKRLFVVQSVRDFLNSQIAEPGKDVEAKKRAIGKSRATA